MKAGALGTAWVSDSLVVGVYEILGVESVSFAYECLYVPAIIPFAIAGMAPLILYAGQLKTGPCSIVSGVAGRMKNPSKALVGALALVTLLRGAPGDMNAPARIIGVRVSDAMGQAWVGISFLLGVLGSFFSGSTTVSCLTFAAVQKTAAEGIGLDWMSMLSLQACGATAGNAVCINNVIAVLAVLGLKVPEGQIMTRTGPIVFCFYIIATLAMAPFLFDV